VIVKSRFYYHWVDASAVELLDPEDIIHPVVSVTITGSMPGELLDPEGIIQPVVSVTITRSMPLLVSY
jgi:hypothetical protein